MRKALAAWEGANDLVPVGASLISLSLVQLDADAGLGIKAGPEVPAG